MVGQEVFVDDTEKLGGDVASPNLIKRLIICSNVLPVRLTFDQEKQLWSVSFERDVLFEDGPMYVEIGDCLKKKDDYEVLYVGVPGTYVPQEDRLIVEQLLQGVNCYPVWLDKDRAHNHFQGFCKGVLWSTFHNVIDLYSKSIGDLSSGNGSRKNTSAGIDTVEQNDKKDGNKTLAREMSLSQNDSADLQWAQQRQWSPMEAEKCWPDHCAVNRQFATKVISVYSEGDVVWVHDYHLMLVPSFLSRKLPSASLGFFLHIPFPSSECFRVLANRDDILKSLLSADHIGFHLYEYARHFLTCCKRMLGLSCEAKQGGVIGVKYQGRTVSITCSHVGLNPDTYVQRLNSSYVQQMVHRFSPLELGGGSGNIIRASRGYRGNMSLIIGIDEIEGLRGLSLKLLGIMRFLEMFPNMRNQVQFRQIGVRLDSRPDDYLSTTREVNKLVQKINKKYGRTIVQYEERSMIELDERLALMKAADIFLVTAVRGGLNILPFEYCLARRDDSPGVIILSEFSACSRVLNGALRLNPFRTEDLAAAIEEGLSMSLAEKTARRNRDLDFIESHDIYSWSQRIIKDIVDSHKSESESLIRYGLGFGVNRRGLGNKEGELQELDTVKLCEDYKQARRRVLFLDYSGTLVETTGMDMYLKKGGKARVWHYDNGGSRRPGGCLETRDPISDNVRSSLIELCRDPANHVFVISADLRDELEHALEGIPNLGLIAENGYVYKLSPGDEWHPVVEESGNAAWYGGTASIPSASSMADSLDDPYGGGVADAEDPKLHGWQDVVMNVIMPYTGRTNGSFCWRAPSAVSFNFVLADPELGYLQADNLFLELEYVLAGMPLSVEKGKGFVTVRLAGVTRGAAAAAILKSINRKASLGTDGNKNKVDFIVAFGDDIEDETVFKEVKKYKDNALPAKKFATRVGWTHKKTRATYYVDDAGDVGDVLNGIITSTEDISNKFRRSASVSRLSSQFVTKESLITKPGGGSFRHRAPIVPQEPKHHSLNQNASEFVYQVEARSEGLKNMNPKSRSATIASFRMNGQSNMNESRSRKLHPDIPEGQKTNEKIRNVIPHSPSYIASPEEAAAMFAGQPIPHAGTGVLPGAGGSFPPSAADEEIRDYLRHQGSLTRLNEKEYDAGIRDPREIPPTRGESKAAREENLIKLLNPEISRDSEEIDPEHIDNAEMYVSGMLATESGPDLNKQIDFVDVNELSKRTEGLLDKQTVQMVLSGLLGAGLMFILLNAGKQVQTTTSSSSRSAQPKMG